MSVTPTVFCAVVATMAVVPYTPQRKKALRSAWMPAPAPESLVAMLITRFKRPPPVWDPRPEAGKGASAFSREHPDWLWPDSASLPPPALPGSGSAGRRLGLALRPLSLH